jgi:uncharacterized protein (TIGR02145 family)
MRHNVKATISLLVIGMLFTCEEVEKNQVPTISFIHPMDSSAFMPGDSILFTVEVNDFENDMREVRFYLNGDGVIADQEWPYSYTWHTSLSDSGYNTIKAEAIDNLGEIGKAEITVTIQQTPPIATFSGSPSTGTPLTVFTFDASYSWDQEDDADQLQIRWDWESDGQWDTEYSNAKIENHQFKYVGLYLITMEVKDRGNAVTEDSRILIIEEDTTCVDYDGNEYATIHIGNQIWMAENLRTTHYTTGQPIPYLTQNELWSTTDSNASCIYNNDEGNAAIYGRLYNWDAATHYGLAPNGWRVPGRQDLEQLIEFLGGADIAGGKLKENGLSHWLEPNESNNESGFSALPGGGRLSDGTYVDLGRIGGYWTNSPESGTNSVMYFHLSNDTTALELYPADKQSGLSIRCIKR